MSQRALCIGINNYPGTENDLSGCVNDAHDWQAALTARGFSVTTLLDSQATKAAMVAAMKTLIGGASKGDSLIITYSGHGTFVPDDSGDETDGHDEALCPYDINDDQPLIDDEIRALFHARKPGVKMVMISDSCHSGSVVRWAKPSESDIAGAPKARFLPPAAWLPRSRLPKDASGQVASRTSSRPKAGPLASSGDLLLAGCRDSEFSYDATFAKRNNGAMTYFALKTLAALPPGTSYAKWFAAIRSKLPSRNFPQTPQILGTKACQAWPALA